MPSRKLAATAGGAPSARLPGGMVTYHSAKVTRQIVIRDLDLPTNRGPGRDRARNSELRLRGRTTRRWRSAPGLARGATGSPVKSRSPSSSERWTLRVLARAQRAIEQAGQWWVENHASRAKSLEVELLTRSRRCSRSLISGTSASGVRRPCDRSRFAAGSHHLSLSSATRGHRDRECRRRSAAFKALGPQVGQRASASRADRGSGATRPTRPART